MKFNTNTVSAILGGFMAATLSSADAAEAQNTENRTVQIQVHETMSPAQLPYAERVFLGHVLTGTPRDRIVREGLHTLAEEAVRRGSVEPSGIVGIDLENDDYSFIPFLYWPLSDQSPNLSEAAMQNLQNYMNNGGFVVIDIQDHASIVNSQAWGNLRTRLQAPSYSPLVEGDALTQTFYIVSTLPGTQNHTMWIEPNLNGNATDEEFTPLIIANNNWAGAWAGVTVPVEQREVAIRSGINMLYGALTGNYRLDPEFVEIIEIKRGFQENDPPIPAQPSE